MCESHPVHVQMEFSTLLIETTRHSFRIQYNRREKYHSIRSFTLILFHVCSFSLLVVFHINWFCKRWPTGSMHCYPSRRWTNLNRKFISFFNKFNSWMGWLNIFLWYFCVFPFIFVRNPFLRPESSLPSN